MLPALPVLENKCTRTVELIITLKNDGAISLAILKFSEQVRRHSVALISLAVAISSFAYNSWRNEQSEANRNIRTAGIELLIKLGELDRVVLHAQYGKDADPEESVDTMMYTRTGWAYVLTVRDLGSLTAAPAKSSSLELYEIWKVNFDHLGESDEKASDAISDSIDQVRADVLEVMAALD